MFRSRRKCHATDLSPMESHLSFFTALINSFQKLFRLKLKCKAFTDSGKIYVLLCNSSSFKGINYSPNGLSQMLGHFSLFLLSSVHHGDHYVHRSPSAPPLLPLCFLHPLGAAGPRERKVEIPRSQRPADVEQSHMIFFLPRLSGDCSLLFLLLLLRFKAGEQNFLLRITV